MTLARVLSTYPELNGDHPMTAADDAYVRAHFAQVPDSPDLPRERAFELMAEGQLPLPAYVCSDGTPMVYPDYLEPIRAAGSVDALKSWFLAHWTEAEQSVAVEEWDAYLSGQYVCLWSVTPETIQAKTTASDAIKAEVTTLEKDPGSTTALKEAVDTLDALEPPFTAYDELRFGGPTSRQVWIEDVRRAHGL